MHKIEERYLNMSSKGLTLGNKKWGTADKMPDIKCYLILVRY